jgi:hypothetical protein
MNTNDMLVDPKTSYDSEAKANTRTVRIPVPENSEPYALMFTDTSFDILDSVAEINDAGKTMLRNVLNDPDVNYTVDDVTFAIHGDEPIVIIDDNREVELVPVYMVIAPERLLRTIVPLFDEDDDSFAKIDLHDGDDGGSFITANIIEDRGLKETQITVS